jgi:PilZ domain-containing protein
MKLKMPDPKTSIAFKVLAPLDRRYAERAPINCKVIYSGEDGARIVKVEGTVQDLSKTGCKILGTTQPIMGHDLALILYLDDGKAPLCLAGAQITWVKGLSFAIRFPRLTPEERKRLQDVIWKNVTLSPANSQRTAFRIA